MKITEINRLINSFASVYPNINEVITSGNIWEINERKDIKYNVFCSQVERHRIDVENEKEYFTYQMYYVDRLLENGENKHIIQSQANDFFMTLINALNQEGLAVYDYSITPFTQRFNDMCAGAMLDVQFEVDYFEEDDCNNQYNLLNEYAKKKWVKEQIRKEWFGTQEEYDALTDIDNNTLYYIFEN